MRQLAVHLLLLGLLFSANSFSQKGHIYVSNFFVDASHFDSKINSIEFGADGLAYVAGRRGMAVFDGINWESLENVPGNVSKLKADTAQNKIYIGLKGAIGSLKKGDNGRYEFNYLRISGNPELEFSKILLTKSKVIFYSNKLIYALDKKNTEIVDSITPPGGGTFSGIFSRNNLVFVNIRGKGFHRLTGNKFQYVTTVSDLKKSNVLFSTKFNKTSVLIGTNKNQIYLFNGKNFVQFARHTEIREFLEENILWDGIDFSRNYFALTTLTGGCAIIDKSYGKIVNVINYQTGLADDEIYAINRDANNGIWLSHQHGISRCDPNLPLKDFSTYPGLSGNINDILVKSKVLYTATNDGVFVLQGAVHNQNRKSSGGKKGIRLGQKNRKSYIKQSITHEFKHISNLKEKCKRIYSFGSNIIALTNFGLYEISGMSARPIMTNIYPNDIHVSGFEPAIFVATLDGVYKINYKKDSRSSFNSWSNKKIVRDIQSQVYSVVQDKHGNLFIGIDSKAFLCAKDDIDKNGACKQLVLPEPTEEPINLIANKGEVYFIQSTGIYIYNIEKKQILYQDIRSITTKNLQCLTDRRNAWVKEDVLWEPVTDLDTEFPSELLSIFKNIREIYSGRNGEIWIITGDNQLLKIPGKVRKKINYDFNVSVRKLQDNADSLYSISKAVIPYWNNAIKIDLNAPFYLRPEEVKYQYLIDGLKNYDEWSEWSLNPAIELSSIKSGRYKISIRAKNTFNQISEEKIISVRILKPIWQKRSFQIIATLSFLGIVALVFYITHRRLLRKKRILEQKVKERTIELEEEKDKTEKLLLNILPRKTAEELKKFNKVVPRNYDNATILFTDFKGFTQIAEKLTPEELVNEIDLCFKEFDNIISKYRIEKIKTIGDAYMCAGGLPTKYKYNSLDVIKAALDIRDYMDEYRVERKKKGIPFFEIRIGVHTGKVVAGVVGTRKYAYDIWGDAVNLAARMESSGEPGKVNVSGDTYKLIKDKFNCTHRGKIKAKNKGEVDMYFVDSPKRK